MLGESTALDHAASTTFIDIGGECEEITDEPWIHMFPNEDLHVFSLAGHNLPEGFASLSFEITSTDEGQEWWSKANSTVSTVKFKGGSETGRSNYQADYSDLTEGHYSITFEISVYNQSNLTGASIVEGGEQIDKTIEFEISKSKQTIAFLHFIDDETKQEIRVTDTGARSCWSVQDLGDWGYILIGAELGGGRETAMLSGGSAGIHAWWMAFTSLSLSAITLLVIYPLMYKIYHQESDDILSRAHIGRLVEEIDRKSVV